MNISGTILEDYAKDEKKEFVLIYVTINDDGYGGQVYQIVEGAKFDGLLILNTSIQGEIAKKQGVTGVYTFAYPKYLKIPPRQIIRRISDNKYFRTIDMDGVPTPDVSTLDMKVTRLEDYTLPQNDIEE